MVALILGYSSHAVPAAVLERDVTQPYTADPGVIEVLGRIYAEPVTYWDAYEMCEELVDVEESFQLWRFRHLKTVERIIGFKRGTGGTAGVDYLRRMLDVVLFPDLWDLRSAL